MARRIGRLPAKLDRLGRIDTLTSGAKKALTAMRSEYGAKEGNRIFLAKADEQGTGRTLRQKVNATYKKGARL
jgi:hypothetical protein